jgi:WD40 repeat protein
VWDLETGLALRSLEGHSGTVNGVALTPDGKRAVSASHDHTLKVWDLETGLALRTLEGHDGPVRDVAVTRDGRRAISASEGKTLKLWNLQEGNVIATFYCDDTPRCCAFADDDRVVAGDDGGRVYFLSLEEPPQS